LFAVCRGKKLTAKPQLTANVAVYRVLKKKAHSKALAHGKEAMFAVCLIFYTRQNFGTRQNYEKKDSALLFFSTIHIYIYSVLYSLLKFGVFLVIFAIFSHLISLIEFLGLNWKCFE